MGSDPALEPPGKVFPLPGKGEKTLPDVKYWSPSAKPLPTDVIQHGFTYTPRVKNEHASCGGANMMAPLLKHWTALPALSYFLTNAMHIRESSRRIVVPSTFKPPPRVTLTESKRASWLTDLANPQVPLRKLGRAIPGGLKGGDLIEQLYTYKVPLFRSLWLIKCVGASELRTLKRKILSSTGAEGTDADQTPEKIWLQEWTESVLTKFEQTMDQFDDTTEWGTKCCYILDTIAALFSEGLVDQSLLISWTLSTFEQGSATILPANVYLANKIWPALILEPTAVRLACAICTRSAKISASAAKTLHVIDALILRLFDTCPDAFILPELWPQLEAQLRRATTLPALFTKVARSQPDILRSIESMRDRNAIFMVSQSAKFSPQWQAAIQIDQILSHFSLPFSIPQLVNDLRELPVQSQDLFNALMSWTLRRANDRVIHLTLAICQQVTSTEGTPLDDYLVSYLMSIKPSQAGKTLFNLLGWFYKSSIFSIEKYFRRLIASGVMHLKGPQSDTHRRILRNLPFLYMKNTLRGQARMLLRESIEDTTTTVADLIEQAASLYSASQPAPVVIESGNLSRDQELRVSGGIFNEYKRRISSEPAKISPLLLSAVVRTIDSLGDKYTIFKIIWLTFSKLTSQSLFLYTYLLCTQYTYFFLCMRVVPAIIQILYDRRSYFTLNIQHSFETSGVVMMLRSGLQDKPESKLLDSFLKSIETLYVPPNMTPENDEAQIDGVAASKLLSEALERGDKPALLRLGEHMPRQQSQFVQIFGTWLDRTSSPSVDLIAWLLSSFYIYFSDVYNMLVDKHNQILYQLLFELEKSFDLEPLEQEYLNIARQTFIMLAPPDEVLYILSTVDNPIKLAQGITLLLKRARYNSDVCSDMLFNFKPDSPGKSECLERIVEQQVGLDLGQSPQDKFYHLLENCNAFNTGFCQIGCWLTFRGLPTEEIVATVLRVLKSGMITLNTVSWQVIFKLLDTEVKSALHAASEAEFLTGPVPNPCVDHLLLILMSLEQFSKSASRLHDHASELINYLGQVTNACKLRTVDAVEIEPTLLLILKLIVIECAPSTELKEGTGTLDSEYSNVILPTVAALCLGLQESPVVEESATLSSMVADVLRILNRREDTTNTPSFNVLDSSLGGLMMFSRSNNTYTNLDAWPFDLIEENASGSGNDVSLDLSRFETYVEIKDTS